MSREVLEHRVRKLEHDVGGNGQPGLWQHVTELRAVAAQARILGGFAQIIPSLIAAVGGFFLYAVIDDVRTLMKDIRAIERINVRQDGEVKHLQFRLDQLPPLILSGDIDDD